jgi:hypothetical protein
MHRMAEVYKRYLVECKNALHCTYLSYIVEVNCYTAVYYIFRNLYIRL